MRSALSLATVVVLPVLAGCLGQQDLEPSALPGLGLPTPVCLAPCRHVIDDRTGSWWEPSAAANPLDPMHLVVAANAMGVDAIGRPTRWDYTHVARDGGATWQSAPFPGGLEAGPDHPLFTASALGDPVVAFLPDGTLLHVALAFREEWLRPPEVAAALVMTGADLIVARSSDGGLTYPEEDIRVVARGQGVWALAGLGPPGGPSASVNEMVLWDAPDKPWLAVGPGGDVLLAWNKVVETVPPDSDQLAKGGGLRAVHSPDGGRTWGPVRTVAQGGYWAAPAILNDGTWVIASADFPLLSVAISGDRGESWEVRKVAAEADWYLTLKVQPRPDGERLLVLYARVQGPDVDSGDRVPSLLWSDDRGATWQGPLALDVPEAPGQPLPALDVGPDGLAWATFFHPYTEGEEWYADYLAVLLGDGVASPPLLLESGIRGSTGRLGHYMGLAVVPGGAFAAWATSEGGEARALVGAKVAAADMG